MEVKDQKQQETKNGAILKQWQDLKAKHPDAVLLFRQGDNYKMFNVDADEASRVLRIASNPPQPNVSGEKGFDKVAVFPYHMLDTHLPKLIRAGNRVAICDQLEAPKRQREQAERKPLDEGKLTEKDRTLVENAVGKTFTNKDDNTWTVNKIEKGQVHGIMNGAQNILGIGEVADMLKTRGWKEKDLSVADKAETVATPEKKEETPVEQVRKSYSRKDGKMSAEDKALDRFADMMIEKIQSIKDDWHKPWFTEGTMAWPKNLSGRDYNGMNALMLMMQQEKAGYKLPVYATFASYQRLNNAAAEKAKKKGEEAPLVMVNKGEKGFPVFITTFTVIDKETKEKIPYDDYKKLSKEEQDKYNVYPKLHVYNVFNVGQTNMQEVQPELWKKLEEQNFVKKPEQKGEVFSFPAVDKMISDNLWICPIKPTQGDNAYYSISKDEIVVPLKSQFKDGESFYSNLFHEMGHSTGAENQLNRIKPADFGSKEYAREELVAELTAALTSQRYGITKNIKSDSAAYLKSWLSSLKEEPDFIKTTLNDVKKATTLLTNSIDGVSVQMQKVKEPEQARDVVTNISTAAQYDYSKKLYPDTMLIIQNDLTFTMLDKDAEKASKILNIPLMEGQEAKWRGGDKAVEFNAEIIKAYVDKLQKAGEQVWIQNAWTEKVMELHQQQREQPKETKEESVEFNKSTAMKKKTDSQEPKQSSGEEKTVKTKTPRKTKQASDEKKTEEKTEQKSERKSTKKASSKDEKAAEVKAPAKDEQKQEVKSSKVEQPNAETKAENKTEAQSATKAETKVDAKTETKADVKEQTKTESVSTKEDKSKEVKEDSGEKQKREPQLITVNGDKVTHAHAFQHNTQPDLWLFTAKLNDKQLHPMVMSKEDVAAYQAKETSVKDLMERYYPTKMQQRLTPEEYKAGKQLSNGQTVDKFSVFKESKPENADYGRWKGYAEVGDKKMVATMSSADLNAYFDRTKTPAQIVESTFGEKLHLASAYEKYKLPEGVQEKDVRIAKSKEGKWTVSVDMGENGITSKKPISFDDGQSYFKEKTATRGQIAAKYLSSEMNEMKGMSQNQEQKRGRGL